MNISDYLDPIDSTSPSSQEHDSQCSPKTQPDDQQKREIAGWVADGMGLSEVQKTINQDFGLVMTYMDVRFLVDDLDLTLTDKVEEKPNDPKDDTGDTLSSPNDPLTQEGVTVELDTVNPPGAMASGSVTFSDGQQKKWTLDQFGRLGLSGGEDGYKPSDEDVVEFQKQLDGALRNKGF